ncbi:MAG: TRAP transporter substrate-binding protein DctP [Acidobacteria bacterium]|nr:TRAP transporter substrate-binding protein DctP [Acidobacteriota bacterium]
MRMPALTPLPANIVLPAIAALSACLAAAGPAAAAGMAAGGPAAPAVVIKMGTSAPEGSSWHQIFKEMGEKWKQAPGGGVTLRIYPGGVLGDEPDLVRKMRVGQIQAAALTSVGLSDIDESVAALSVPMLYRSYAELDHVRERLRPVLERSLEKKDFLVLNWGDAGWVMFFSKEPFRTPDDLRRMKLFVWAGDNDAVELWKASGFHPIPLAATDILPGLQSGLINAFDTTPLLALASQWFGLAPHLLDLKWAPLVGATVLTRKAWEKVPAQARPLLLRAAAEAGERLKGEIRAANEQAIEAMKKRGLRIVPVTPEIEAAWRRAAEGAYPKIRGPIVPPKLFDEALRLRDEHRSSAGKPAGGGPGG